MKQFNYKCVAKNGNKMYYKKTKGKWKRITNKVGMKAEKGKRKYKMKMVTNNLITRINKNIEAWDIILDCFKNTEIDETNEHTIQRDCEKIAKCIEDKRETLISLNFPQNLNDDFNYFNRKLFPGLSHQDLLFSGNGDNQLKAMNLNTILDKLKDKSRENSPPRLEHTWLSVNPVDFWTIMLDIKDMSDWYTGSRNILVKFRDTYLIPNLTNETMI